MTGESRFDFPEVKISLFVTASRPTLGSSYAALLGAPFLEVRRQGRGYSSPPNAKVMNAWSYTSTPAHIFMTWRFIKNKDNFSRF
jgi:hypothetical protein